MSYTPREALAWAAAAREIEKDKTLRDAAIARAAQADEKSWQKFMKTLETGA